MTATRIDPRPQQLPPYKPTPAEQRRRNLAAVRALRTLRPGRLPVDLAGIPAHERHQEALTKTVTRARSTR